MRKLTPIILAFIFSTMLGALAANQYSTQQAKLEKTYIIKLIDNQAKPSVLTVKPGQTVEFDASDGKPHDLAQGHGSEMGGYAAEHDHTVGGLESGKFNADEAYRLKFQDKGTFAFHDHLNPNIYATIVVY